HAILGHRHRLSGIAVAVVTGRLLLLILEVYIQLSGQHPLRQALLQLADQTVVAQQPGAVLAPLQQLVDQLIINRRFGASCHVPLLGSVSWLNTQNLLHPLPAYIHSAKGCSFDFVLRVVPPDASGSDRTRSLFELGADNRQLKQRASSTLVQHVQSDCSPSPFRPLSNRPL